MPNPVRNASLTTSQTHVGSWGTGNFNQSSGTHTTSELDVGYWASSSNSAGTGTYNMTGGKLNTRVLWFFQKHRRIVAVHAIRNKGQAIPARDLHTARERMRDWRKRTEP